MSDKDTGKSQWMVLLGAAFLMATSAIGPGFLTQTATFTNSLKTNFGFVILVSLILALVVQLNVWRVIGVSGLRGQDIANKLLPGLGFVVAFLIAIGGLAFNIGNIGGTALGFNSLLGLDVKIGYFVAGLLGIIIFISKSAKSIVDRLVQVLGIVMLVVILVVAFITKPPVGEVVVRTFVPNVPFGSLFFPILTLLGGTVGGYITFSGGHRLLDAGISGKDNLKKITQSSVMGISVAAVVRILLFLAVLGVVWAGSNLDPSNPAGSAFLIGAGQIGGRFFGIVLLAAGLTSVIGAAYTSVSFLKTLFAVVMKYERYFIIGFIAFSTLVMAFVGSPAKVLVLVGFLNGLILPITLSIILLGSGRKDIVGNDYKHPVWLIVLGVIVVALTLFLGIRGFPGMIASLRA